MITFLKRLISRWRMRRAFVRWDLEIRQVIYQVDQGGDLNDGYCEHCPAKGHCSVCGSKH